MLKRRYFLMAGVLAVCLVTIPLFLERDGQVVLDDADWALASLNELDGTMEVLTDGNAHPPIYQVNILRPGKGLEDIHLEKLVPAEVLGAQKPLSLRFKARAATPRRIRTTLQSAQSDTWTSDVELSREWQEFRLPIKTSVATTGSSILAFQIGGASGEVAITEIQVVQS
ncbi:hypothetical protein [Armatimonas sp.]|uniref:hypothetical protein n=1 Tax=Armatimonas sp. TaxID=1872638 RepID=UPI00286A00D6|nr:hypothetical protein [Armatimonas sp.]